MDGKKKGKWRSMGIHAQIKKRALPEKETCSDAQNNGPVDIAQKKHGLVDIATLKTAH